MSLADFDPASRTILEQYSITIDANQTTKTITLEAIHDADLEVEEARLWIQADAAYGIVRDDVASNVPGAAPGTFLHPWAPLQVISGVALFGEYRSHDPDITDPALVDVNDVNQGNLGDCYLWTAVVALITKVPGYIEQLIHVDASAPPGVYRYFVDLKNADGTPNQRTVTLDLARGLDSADLSGDTDAAGLAEVWTLVLEQAYAQILPNGYADLDDGGLVSHAWTALTGKSAVALDVSNWTDEQIAARIAQEYAGNKIMAIGTPKTGGKKEQDVLPDDVRGHHAYFVESVNVEDSSAKSLGLKNPWGHSHTTLFRDHYSEAISTLYILERP